MRQITLYKLIFPEHRYKVVKLHSKKIFHNYTKTESLASVFQYILKLYFNVVIYTLILHTDNRRTSHSLHERKGQTQEPWKTLHIINSILKNGLFYKKHLISDIRLQWNQNILEWVHAVLCWMSPERCIARKKALSSVSECSSYIYNELSCLFLICKHDCFFNSYSLLHHFSCSQWTTGTKRVPQTSVIFTLYMYDQQKKAHACYVIWTKGHNQTFSKVQNE